MSVPAERALKVRVRRRAQDLAELRLVLPDSRSAAVRRRVAALVDGLTLAAERDALNWIEAVSEFDEPADQTPC
jgi:hypothetical protein